LIVSQQIPLENKFVKALEHFSLIPFSKLILNETILIIFSTSQRLESFAAHPLIITVLETVTVAASVKQLPVYPLPHEIYQPPQIVTDRYQTITADVDMDFRIMYYPHLRSRIDAYSLSGLIFDPEDGGSTFLRKVSKHLPD
jgi:hypothetical protein